MSLLYAGEADDHKFDRIKDYGVMARDEDGDEEDIGFYWTLEQAKTAYDAAVESGDWVRVALFNSGERYCPEEDNIFTVEVYERNFNDEGSDEDDY